MFIGHWAPAFAVAAAAPESPRLGTLFVAAQLVDWAFALFVLGGVEHLRLVPGITAMNPLDLYHMPLSHSLLGTAVFALVFGVAIGAGLRNTVAGFWAAVVVLSHWLLDLVVHRPDLTLVGGEDKLGWGLWNVPGVALPLELAITLGCFVWYVRATKGPLGPPLILIAAMLAFQAFSWFGPEPQGSPTAMVLTMMTAFAILTALAFWVGRTRWHNRHVGLAVASVRR